MNESNYSVSFFQSVKMNVNFFKYILNELKEKSLIDSSIKPTENMQKLMDENVVRIGHTMLNITPGVPLNYQMAFLTTCESTQSKLNKYNFTEDELNDVQNSISTLSKHIVDDNGLCFEMVPFDSKMLKKDLVGFIQLHKMMFNTIIFLTKGGKIPFFFRNKETKEPMDPGQAFDFFNNSQKQRLISSLSSDHDFYPMSVTEFKEMKRNACSLVMLHIAYYLFNFISKDWNNHPFIDIHILASKGIYLSGVNITGMKFNDPDAFIKNSAFSAPVLTLTSMLKQNEAFLNKNGIKDTLKHPLSRQILDIPSQYSAKSFELIFHQSDEDKEKISLENYRDDENKEQNILQNRDDILEKEKRRDYKSSTIVFEEKLNRLRPKTHKNVPRSSIPSHLLFFMSMFESFVESIELKEISKQSSSNVPLDEFTSWLGWKEGDFVELYIKETPFFPIGRFIFRFCDIDVVIPKKRKKPSVFDLLMFVRK